VLFLELQQTRISHLPKSSKYLKTFFLVDLSCSLFDSIRLKESEVSQLLFSRKGCTRKCELGWCHLHLICRCLAFHRSQLSQCIYPWGGSRCLQCLISDLACKKSSILSWNRKSKECLPGKLLPQIFQLDHIWSCSRDLRISSLVPSYQNRFSWPVQFFGRDLQEWRFTLPFSYRCNSIHLLHRILT